MTPSLASAGTITTHRVLFPPETERVIVGQQKLSNGSVKQRSARGRGLLAVVDVVAFCRGDIFLEVGDAVLNEDVVPGDELLDVAVLHALLIPLGQAETNSLYGATTTGV